MSGLRPRAAVSWSGGKDSCAALQHVHGSFDVVAMVTMFDEAGARSRSHGLRPEILAAQAERLGLRRVAGTCTWDTYDAVFSRLIATLAQDGITHVIFGDILFEEHRRWAEQMCEQNGLVAVEPLWGLSTDDLFDDWVASRNEAMIVTARGDRLDETWLGRTLTADMRDEFSRRGVDACGEHGEYHTLVTNTPLFSSPLKVRRGLSVQRSGCWALDVEVENAAGD